MAPAPSAAAESLERWLDQLSLPDPVEPTRAHNGQTPVAAQQPAWPLRNTSPHHHVPDQRSPSPASSHDVWKDARSHQGSSPTPTPSPSPSPSPPSSSSFVPSDSQPSSDPLSINSGSVRRSLDLGPEPSPLNGNAVNMGGSPITCPRCSWSFRRVEGLRRHINLHGKRLSDCQETQQRILEAVRDQHTEKALAGEVEQSSDDMPGGTPADSIRCCARPEGDVGGRASGRGPAGTSGGIAPRGEERREPAVPDLVEGAREATGQSPDAGSSDSPERRGGLPNAEANGSHAEGWGSYAENWDWFPGPEA